MTAAAAHEHKSTLQILPVLTPVYVCICGWTSSEVAPRETHAGEAPDRVPVSIEATLAEAAQITERLTYLLALAAAGGPAHAGGGS